MANRAMAVVGGISIFVLGIVVIVLGVLYGTKKCDVTDGGGSAAVTTPSPTPVGPSMVHFRDIKSTTGMHKLEDTDAHAWIKTIAFSLVGGKEMQGGVLRVDTGPPLEYTHWYEGIIFVLSGVFQLSNGTTGTHFTMTAGQNMYIPRGVKMSYKSIDASGFIYFCVQPPSLEHSTQIQKAMEMMNTSVDVQPEAMKMYPDIPYFENKYNSSSYLIDTLFSKVKGAEMSAGLYKILAGPALHYTYEYEEFKYIVSGVFTLVDGTGKSVSARAGDLMYFPTNTYVKFSTPNYGLGFYVGQREGGTA